MKEKDTVNEKAESPVLEMADLAMKNYQQALKTGLKLQEEAGRVCSSMFNQTTSALDYQKQFTQMTGVVNGIFSSVQKRSEEVFDLLEKTSRTSVELAKRRLTLLMFLPSLKARPNGSTFTKPRSIPHAKTRKL